VLPTHRSPALTNLRGAPTAGPTSVVLPSERRWLTWSTGQAQVAREGMPKLLEFGREAASNTLPLGVRAATDRGEPAGKAGTEAVNLPTFPALVISGTPIARQTPGVGRSSRSSQLVLQL